MRILKNQTTNLTVTFGKIGVIMASDGNCLSPAIGAVTDGVDVIAMWVEDGIKLIRWCDWLIKLSIFLPSTFV